MTARSFALLSLLCAAPLVQPALAQTADEVVEKHLAAIGGRAALGQLTSQRSTGTVTITSDAGNLSGAFEQSAKAPNKLRVLMKLDLSQFGMPDPLVVEQKFDGETGFMLNSMQGNSEITGSQLDNMRNSTFPSPLTGYKERGTTIELDPRQRLGDRDVFVLVMRPKAGSASRLYVDAETFMVVRTVATVHVPQAGGDLEQTVDLLDYREVNGIKSPFKLVMSNPLQMLTITLESIEHNVPLDDALFAVKRQ